MSTCRVLWRLSLASLGVVPLGPDLIALAFRLLDNERQRV